MICSGQDFIEAMMWNTPDSGKPKKNTFELPEHLSIEEKTVISLLQQNNEMLIDDISWKSQLPINKIASLLLTLEFEGLVKSLPGKKFKLR